MRGYVIEREFCSECDEDNGKKCIRCEVLERMVRELAAKWNSANSREEQRRWSMSREQREEAHEILCEDFSEKADFAVEKDIGQDAAFALYKSNRQEYDKLHLVHYNRLWAEQREKENAHVREMEAAEELLGRLGARMMRPYEHWNEEESRIQWLETRHENDDDWDY